MHSASQTVKLFLREPLEPKPAAAAETQPEAVRQNIAQYAFALTSPLNGVSTMIFKSSHSDQCLILLVQSGLT
jgi:hypothetical protein